jgi:hypothetical protein
MAMAKLGSMLKGVAVTVSLAFGSPALGADVALSVGQTKVINVAGTSRVEVSDPSVVKVKVLRGTGVALEGKTQGRTDVRIIAGGAEVELRLSVLSPGAQVMTVTRN